MIFFKRCAASVLLSSLFVLIASAQSNEINEKSQTLFAINERPVSTDEFIYLYRKNHQHKPEEFTRDKIEAYLTLFVNYKLKVEEAISRGMDTTSAFKKEYQTYRDELLKPYMPDSKVIDSMVLLTYNRLKQEVKASHILIAVNPDASPADTLEAYNKISEIRSKAIRGEDFGELAAKYSEEPGAENTKGNLGYFTALQMVFPFEQAAYLTPVGEVSEPVRTKFGYHIVKVHNRQPSRGEVEVSHIMIRSDGEESTDARDTIFDIYDKLQKGMSWEELCEQYSQDPNSKDKGGKLRPFGVGGAMASVPAFQDMAFSLRQPGEISDPIQTQFGWHILRLESKIPLPPFEELRPSLTQKVSRDERVKISREALREKMRKQFDYVENTGVSTRLAEIADSLVALNQAVPIANEVLFSMQARPYRVKDFADFIREQPPLPKTISPRQYVEDLFSRFVDHIQIRLLEEKVTRESENFKWLLKEYYEGILLFEIMEREIWNKALEDTVGQRKYFEQHASEFKAGERIVGKIYHSSEKGQLEKLKAMVEDNEEGISDFLAAYRIRQDTGSFEKKDRTIFSKINWAPGIHLTDHNGVNYLVVIEKILPPGPSTFEEARASVISDYQTFLEDSWITELRRKFGVKVNKRAKKRAFSQLINNG